MKSYIPYAHSDVGSPQVEAVVEWLGVNELLNLLTQLPPEQEFPVLLDFLVEFSGGLELAKHRMAETLTEQAAVSYKAHAEVVTKIKAQIAKLYSGGY